MTASPRFQITSIFAAYGAAGVCWGAFVTTLPPLQTISGLSEAGFGLLLSMITIGGIVTMQAMGKVLHRVQAVAIPLCLVGFAIGLAIMGFSSGPVSLGMAMFIAGGASGALDISLNMRAARIETDLGVHLFNRVHALFPFAMLVTSAIVGLLREGGATPQTILPPIAVILFSTAWFEWRAGRHQAPGVAAQSGEGRVRLRGVLLMLGGLAGIGAVMEGGAHTWSALFVERGLGSGPAMGGFAAASITLGLTTGRLMAHRLEHQLRDMAIVRLAALLALPAFLLLAFSSTAGMALAGFFLAGVAIGPVEPAVYRSVAKRHSEADRGRALALATGLAYVGYLAGPPMLGQVIERAGWGPMWAVLGIVSLAACALTLRIPPAKTAT